MRNVVFVMLILFLSFNLIAQKQKYALIIQNTSFANWESLSSQKNNAIAMKNLLLEQGFLEKQITVYSDLTATQTRQAFKKFITSLPEEAIVVVYLSSHGIRIFDNNRDESAMEEADKLDEVFICNDSPKTLNSKTEQILHGGKKYIIDKDSLAIVDDELGFYNDRIMAKIKAGGHYLYLADFCSSSGGTKGSGDVNLEVKVLPKPPQQATFVGILGTTTKINVPPSLRKQNSVGYFVQSFDFALHSFLSNPTYFEFFEAFKNKLLGNLTNHGTPTSTVETPNNKDGVKKLFDNTWRLNLNAFGKVFWKRVIGVKGEGKEENFMVQNPNLYDKEMFVDVYESGKFKTEGIVDSIEDSTLKVDLFIPFKPNSNREYLIKPSEKRHKRLLEAEQVFKTINKKTELYKVLRVLHAKELGVKVKNCLDDFTIRPDTVIFANTRQPVGQKILVEVFLPNKNILINSNPSQNRKLCYTILDVTEEKGLRNCFKENDKVVGFRDFIRNENNELNILRAKVTAPLNESALWVLVSNSKINDKDFEDYFLDDQRQNGHIIPTIQKEYLWNLLKHIVYFEEISYLVIPPK